MDKPRSYTLGARADAKAQLRQRFLRATIDLAEEKLTVEITLDEVATRAGASVQTLLRHFGSRDGLIDEAVKMASVEVVAERATPVGDLDGAVSIIVAHYERRGDFVLRLLGQEQNDQIRAVVEPGKLLHRNWVQQVFAPQLDARPAVERDALTDLLVVATDVYVWKLLRRDRGLDRVTTQARVRELTRSILGFR